MRRNGMSLYVYFVHMCRDSVLLEWMPCVRQLGNAELQCSTFEGHFWFLFRTDHEKNCAGRGWKIPREIDLMPLFILAGKPQARRGLAEGLQSTGKFVEGQQGGKADGCRGRTGGPLKRSCVLCRS